MFKILYFDLNPSPMMQYGIMPVFEKLGIDVRMPRNRLQFEELKYPKCMTSTLSDKEKYHILYTAVKRSDCDIVFLNGANRYYNAVSDACREFSKKFIYWATEDPVLYDLMLPITSKYADLILSPSIECVEKYRSLGLNAQLMMFACNPDYHKPGRYNSKYDLDMILQASCYNHPTRLKGFDTILKPALKLSKEGYRLNVYGAFWDTSLGMKYLKNPLLYKGFHPNEDIPDICASSKIILGIQCSDVSKTQQSMRSFEILASGGFHLTQWTPSMDYFFENGRHLVAVKSPHEAYEKLKYFLKHDHEREKIAQQGMAYVRDNHTYEQRVKQSILPHLKDLIS